MIVIQYDGGCGPWTGARVATWAYTVCHRTGGFNPRGKIYNYKWLHQDWGVAGEGEKMTSNVAEYTGLLEALKCLEKLQIPKDEPLLIQGDSMLVMKMVSRQWGGAEPHVNAKHLRVLLFHVLAWLDGWNWRIKWIPRANNQFCDDLCARAFREYMLIKKGGKARKRHQIIPFVSPAKTVEPITEPVVESLPQKPPISKRKEDPFRPRAINMNPVYNPIDNDLRYPLNELDQFTYDCRKAGQEYDKKNRSED